MRKKVSTGRWCSQSIERETERESSPRPSAVFTTRKFIMIGYLFLFLFLFICLSMFGCLCLSSLFKVFVSFYSYVVLCLSLCLRIYFDPSVGRRLEISTYVCLLSLSVAVHTLHSRIFLSFCFCSFLVVWMGCERRHPNEKLHSFPRIESLSCFFFSVSFLFLQILHNIFTRGLHSHLIASLSFLHHLHSISRSLSLSPYIYLCSYVLSLLYGCTSICLYV